MKKLSLLLAFITVISCGDVEDKIYSGSLEEKTFLSTSQSAYSLPVAIDATGEIAIKLNSSTISSSDRVYTLSIVTDETTANPLTYNLPSSVTIPANSYSGTILVEGMDNGLVDNNIKSLVFLINPNSADESLDNSKITISLFEFCPIPEGSFVGNYLIEELTPFVDGPTLDHGQVVELTATSATGRTFLTRNYPTYCTTTLRAFNFSLVCNQVVVDADQRSTCGCSADGLFFGPATTPSTYDANDDSMFELTFTNDVTSDCGTTVQTTYRFTKQ